MVLPLIIRMPSIMPTSIVEKYLSKAVVHPEIPVYGCRGLLCRYLHKIKGAFLWLGTGFEGNPAFA